MIRQFQYFVILLTALLLAFVLTGCDGSVNGPSTVPQQESEDQKPKTSTEPRDSEDSLLLEDEAKTTGDEKAFVKKVVDGDTIEVVIGGQIFKVRYIGVDTPETKDPRKPVQYFGEEAYQFNRKLVEGKTVTLVKDISNTDRYGRLLRYIFVGDLFVNAELVKQGYARVSTYPPDVKYAGDFLKLEREARLSNRGLWAKGEEQDTRNMPKNQPGLQSQGNFIGNKNSKKLHSTAHSKCRSYISAMNSSNKVAFNSEDRGIKAGYKPCKACY